MKFVQVLAVALVLGWSEAFQANLAPHSTVSSTRIQAAISPQSNNYKHRIPSVNELKTKRGELVVEPYYGVPNGILLAAPALLALHSGTSLSNARRVSNGSFPVIAFFSPPFWILSHSNLQPTFHRMACPPCWLGQVRLFMLYLDTMF